MRKHPAITRLPELTTANLSSIMERQMAAVRNEKTLIPMLWQGLLELRIPVNGRERSAKYYVPKDCPQGAPVVLMNVPEGEQTLNFLEESGWVDLATEEGLCLFLLEPVSGTWGGVAEEAYFLAGLRALLMGRHCLTAFACYIVAYGAPGIGLHKAAMTDPLHVAAAVFLDAGSVDEAYRQEYENKCFDIADRFDPSAKHLCVPYREIPIPVWFASDNIDARTEATIAYWQRAEKAGAPQSDPVFGTVYPQNGELEYTPEGRILKVAVQARSYDYLRRDTTKAIWGFLKQYYRYGMGPRSNMISRRIDFTAIGAMHRRFTDPSGVDREYLVYVPAAFREKAAKLPLVLAYHGASQSMHNMMANGLWHRIAEEEGFVVVCPESGLAPLPGELNRGEAFAYRPLWSLEDPAARPAELIYAEALLDRVIAEFPTDESRIYCSGHSMGCMLTHYLGSSGLARRFAAAGATSGVLRARAVGAAQPLPVFMTMGQFDLWSYRMSDESPVSAAVDMWLECNGLAEEGRAGALRTSEGAEVYREGRWNHYVWRDAEGTPRVRYAWISDKHHVHTWDECRVLWRQWFGRWRVGTDGKRRYAGWPTTPPAVASGVLRS